MSIDTTKEGIRAASNPRLREMRDAIIKRAQVPGADIPALIELMSCFAYTEGLIAALKVES